MLIMFWVFFFNFSLTNFSLIGPCVLKYRKWHKNCIIFNKFLTHNQARVSITIPGQLFSPPEPGKPWSCARKGDENHETELGEHRNCKRCLESKQSQHKIFLSGLCSDSLNCQSVPLPNISQWVSLHGSLLNSTLRDSGKIQKPY